MKAIAFVTRLSRALAVSSPQELTADARLEMLDAINGAIQRIDELSGSKSKTTRGSFYLPAPQTITFDATNGSPTINGNSFAVSLYSRTIRIDGDDIDNQITGSNTLLHPYTGDTGTVSAVIYADAIQLPEPYLEIISDPRIMGEMRDITQGKIEGDRYHQKETGTPTRYWIEGNSGNRNSQAPAIVRFHPMPEKVYRMEADVSLAPIRVKFSDLLAPGEILPVREEWIESYLLPVALSNLTTSELWKDKQTKNATINAGERALERFAALMPSSTYATPSNEVGTPYGF